MPATDAAVLEVHMSPIRRIAATVCAAILAAAAALTLGSGAPAAVDCVPFVLADGVDYSHLARAGWTSDPADGIEALYAPGC